MGLLDLFGHKYPLTDFHELNLDWCITAVLQLQKAFEDFSAGNKLTFADPLQHDLTKTYAKNTIVIGANGNAYMSLQPVPVGVALTDTDYWLIVFDFEDYTEKANKNFTDNYFTNTDRAPYALAADDWIVLDDILYKVTVAIPADGLFIIDTNIVHFTIEQFLKDFVTSVTTTLTNWHDEMTETIDQYKDDIDASELAYRQQLAQDIADTTQLLQAELDAIIHGATSDTEILQARVGFNGFTYSTLKDAIWNQVMLGGVIDNRNLLFSAKERHQQAYYNGSEGSSAQYDYFVVPVENGTTYYFPSGFRFLYGNGAVIAQNVHGTLYTYTADFTGDLYYTAERAYPRWIMTTSGDHNNVQPFDTPSLIRLALKQSLGDSQLFPMSQKAVSQLIEALQLTDNSDERNLLFSSKRYQNKYYRFATGAMSSGDYDYFEVPVTNGQTYYFYPSVRYVATETADIVTSTTADYSYTATYTGILYVTFNHMVGGWICTTSSDYITPAIRPYDAPSATRAVLEQSTGNKLYRAMSQRAVTTALRNYMPDGLKGKKWHVYGDSFTIGDFTGLSPEDYQFADAPYQGENMVYPFFIGRRHPEMSVYNHALGGSTMAYIDGTHNEFSAPDGLYMHIPNDADFITLYFGINDNNNNVPIGTIDDNVNTTFYGAWNIVLDYITTARPNAKIGIIITNGCSNNAYPEAIIAVAKKWGIPYLDLNGDYRLPLVIRVSGRPDTSSTAKNKANIKYRVSSDNMHPNVKCHEDESYCIEEWLKTI